jgi:hypothetical protein
MVVKFLIPVVLSSFFLGVSMQQSNQIPGGGDNGSQWGNHQKSSRFSEIPLQNTK